MGGGTYDPAQGTTSHEAVKVPRSKSRTELQTDSPSGEDGHASNWGRLSCRKGASEQVARGNGRVAQHCSPGTHKGASKRLLRGWGARRGVPESAKSSGG